MQATMNTTKRLLDKLESKSRTVSWDAAKELTLLDRTPRSARAVIRVLKKGRYAHSRAAAAYVLGWWRERQAISTLERIVGNLRESALVREHAAEALAHNHRAESTRVLLRHLHSKCPGVSYACIYALGQSRSKRALAALLPLGNRKQDVIYEGRSLRKEARQAIRSIEERLKKSKKGV